MKNRRLNVLFIAIIALAAAPQALQDMRRLANAVSEQAEREFWTVFLSYQTPGTETVGRTQLVADNRSGAQNGCPLERIMMRASAASSNSRTTGNLNPSRFVQETQRESAKAQPAASWLAASDFKYETIASLDRMRSVEFPEKGRDDFRVTGMHTRDAEKMADPASKSSLAFSWQENENRVKRVMDLDKTLRRKVRSARDKAEPNKEIPAPTADEGM